MDAVTLAAIVGAVLSLIFRYFPKLRDWYAGLSTDGKQQVMGLALLIVSAAIFGLACAGLGAEFKISVTCDRAGALELIQILIMALTTNQATFLITRKKKN